MKKRILTALVGIPLVMWVVFTGGLPFLIVLGLISILAMREFFQLARLTGVMPVDGLGFFGGLLFLLGAYLDIRNYSLLALSILLVAGIFILTLKFPNLRVTDLAVTLVGTIYTAGLLSFVILLKQEDPGGFQYIFWLLALTWANDTGAYVTGKIMGKHKLCPSLSPGKTWEGAVGGIAGALLAAIIIYHWMPVVSPGRVIVLALLVGISGQVGDLFESALKRAAGVKDSGNLLPGHGGMLDRIDSLLLNGAIVYYYLRWPII
ncbi:phosphatidate cytidylyltransferase [Calderihabitans maritimus]|uniref:phosphatidate cytidylyltransferase n=1 Tax=Calderihabitans maritimus TaxID=1246530 RepID=UPI0018643E9F|nr:phosphatidate cytidylyltransferase [Calderihabitans maritimus]